MIKVRTFTSQLKIFHMMEEIGDLDRQVNDFISSNQIRNVISASDALTTGVDGETVGIIRVLTYQES